MITITGASGRLGRGVAQALAALVPPSQVTLGTRDPSRIEALAAQGFRTAVADFDRPGTLEAAFEGADVAFIICGDAANEVRLGQHRNAIDAARRARVGRVVYTSFVNPHRHSLFPFAQVHEDSEKYLQDSGLTHTLLRNNHYAENLDHALGVAFKTGTLALPGAQGKVAYLSRADVAAATAGALTRAGLENRACELTGSAALSLFDVAEIASRVWGRPLAARDMDADEYRAVLTARGLPPYLVQAQVGIRLAAGAGEYAAVSGEAAVLAGRPVETIDRHIARLAGG